MSPVALTREAGWQ